MTKQELLNTPCGDIFFMVNNFDVVEKLQYLAYNPISDVFVFSRDFAYEITIDIFKESDLSKIFRTKKEGELFVLNKQKASIERKIAEISKKE